MSKICSFLVRRASSWPIVAQSCLEIWLKTAWCPAKKATDILHLVKISAFARLLYERVFFGVVRPANVMLKVGRLDELSGVGGHGASQIKFATQNVSGVPKAFCMAKKMGALLGRGALLF